MSKIHVFGLCGLVLVFGAVPNVFAMPSFKKAFDEKYVDEHPNAEFKAAAKKEACNVCHVKGEKKDVRNSYGDALAELIEGSAQERVKNAGANKKDVEAKLLEELKAAFEKTEAKNVDEKDASSPTFGDLIKQGKLPGAK